MSQVNRTAETIQPLSYPSTGRIYDTGSAEFYQLMMKNSIASTPDTNAKKSGAPVSDPASLNLNEHLKTYATRTGIEPSITKDHLLQKTPKDAKPTEKPPSVDPQSTNKNAKDEYVGIAKSYTPAQWHGIRQYHKMLNILEDPYFQHIAS